MTANPESFAPSAIPATAGVGFRTPHAQAFLDQPPPIGWIEVHAETYMAAGGPRIRTLERLRSRYPLSLHGVGLSLGSAAGVDCDHLERLRSLVRRFAPGLVSEHLAWSVEGGVYLNDLLPVPYTDESLAVVCQNVLRTQDRLGRPILVENPSTYLRFAASTMTEAAFLTELVRRTGCGLLLDVNNLYVSAGNHGTDAGAALAALPLAAVGEIHLAGHAVETLADGTVLRIDDHGSAVPEPVWALYGDALARTGPRPTLIEWDTRIPPLPVLLAEAARANRRLAAAARTRAEGVDAA